MFAALAISRHLQEATGISIKKLVHTLRPLQNVFIDVGGHRITAEPTITPAGKEILASLRGD